MDKLIISDTMRMSAYTHKKGYRVEVDSLNKYIIISKGSDDGLIELSGREYNAFMRETNSIYKKILALPDVEFFCYQYVLEALAKSHIVALLDEYKL